ncbi:YqaE/Pmp3 family membrane protein [Halomonas vilamensis]|uniref:YqaE/Pmp3 family membrane protein n=1 Tax=Vreelandella vilamensis TaxID=531309 RepID=A0ABU1H610_9GAMM|nr:YqaE/Pmp3 family membrane protein [Halomonas vilamensis]MDR5899730.1 YqaE/Pmp3 family membrane protein [Halomonas vilamensis]
MDAREYLSRKGVGLDRDPERPNTLEEKAWERARGAGQKRPKAGTPHDWEEWERYHENIAEDAETIEQKIDKEAHRQAEQAGASSKQAASVQHFTPAPSSAKSTSSQAEETPKLSPAALPSGFKAAYIALAVLLPPLAVGLLGGRARNVFLALALTLLAWVPGAFYAVNYANARLKNR